MLDKDQLRRDVLKMTATERYNHVMSAYGVALSAKKGTETFDDAMSVINVHYRLFRKKQLNDAYK